MRIGDFNIFTDKTDKSKVSTSDDTTNANLTIEFPKDGNNNDKNKPITGAEIEHTIDESLINKTDVIPGRPVIHEPIRMKTKEEKEKAKISDMIEKEIDKHSDKINKKTVDIKYWTDKIYSNTTKYNIPAEVIISIIRRECGFDKNQHGTNGNGAMQLTTSPLEDMLIPYRADNVYKKVDEKLYNDIITHMKKIKGKKFTASDMREECKNDDFSIKVGILLFKAYYAQAVQTNLKSKDKEHCKTLVTTIDNLKNGKIKIDKAQNQRCIRDTLKAYNSVYNDYAPDIITSITNLKFDYNKEIIKSNPKK